MLAIQRKPAPEPVRLVHRIRLSREAPFVASRPALAMPPKLVRDRAANAQPIPSLPQVSRVVRRWVRATFKKSAMASVPRVPRIRLLLRARHAEQSLDLVILPKHATAWQRIAPWTNSLPQELPVAQPQDFVTWPKRAPEWTSLARWTGLSLPALPAALRLDRAASMKHVREIRVRVRWMHFCP